MATDTLTRIEQILQEAQTLTPEKRAELLDLLGRLKIEMAHLGATHAGAAQEIATQAQALAEHALSANQDSDSMAHATTRFSDSVRGFEESHPRLVQVTNAICTALSNMGI